MTDTDHRPSPDALLKAAGQVGRGRLKIFLGAAPGVGKTYEMLVQARRRKLDGVDVVIGVVETHRRVETDLLTKGLETVPKKRAAYKGRVLAEMDIDAILQRRPRLLKVPPNRRHCGFYFFLEAAAFARSCFNRCFTMRAIKSYGIGWSKGNRRLPFSPAYGAIARVKPASPLTGG